MTLERIKKKIDALRDEARLDVVQYIEGYYNDERRHSNNGGLSPKQFEDYYFWKLDRVERTGDLPIVLLPMGIFVYDQNLRRSQATFLLLCGSCALT